MRALLKLIKSVDRFYLGANNLFKLAQDSGVLVSKLKQLANTIGDEYPDLADELRELAAQYGSIIKRFNEGKLGGKTLSSVTSLAVSTFLGNQDKFENNPEIAETLDTIINDLNIKATSAGELEAKDIFTQYSKIKSQQTGGEILPESEQEPAPSSVAGESDNEVYIGAPEECQELLAKLPYIDDYDFVDQLRVLARMYATAARMKDGFSTISNAIASALKYIDGVTENYNEEFHDEIPAEYQEYMTIKQILLDIKADIRKRAAPKTLLAEDGKEAVKTLKQIWADFEAGRFNKADTAQARAQVEVDEVEKSTRIPELSPMEGGSVYDPSGGLHKEQTEKGPGGGSRFITLTDNIDWATRYYKEKQNYVDMLNVDLTATQKRNVLNLINTFDNLIKLYLEEQILFKKVQETPGQITILSDKSKDLSKQIVYIKTFMKENEGKLSEKQIQEFNSNIAKTEAVKKETEKQIKELLTKDESAGGPNQAEKNYYTVKDKIKELKIDKAKQVIAIRDVNLTLENKKLDRSYREETDYIKKELVAAKMAVNDLLKSNDQNKQKTYQLYIKLINLLIGRGVDYNLKGTRLPWWSTERKEPEYKNIPKLEDINRLKLAIEEEKKNIIPHSEIQSKETGKIKEEKKTFEVVNPTTGTIKKLTDWANVELTGYEKHFRQSIATERGEVRRKVKKKIEELMVKNIGSDYEFLTNNIAKAAEDRKGLREAVSALRTKLKADLVNDPIFTDFAISVRAGKFFRKLLEKIKIIADKKLDLQPSLNSDEIEFIKKIIQEAETLHSYYSRRKIKPISPGEPERKTFYSVNQIRILNELIPYLHGIVNKNQDIEEEAPPTERTINE